MSDVMLSRQLLRITAIARLLALLAMGAPILWTHNLGALLALGTIALLWLVAQLASQTAPLVRWTEPTVEATAVGVVCGLGLHSSPAILAALALPPFVAGLRRGVAGVALATSAQLLATVAALLVWAGRVTTDDSLGVFTWSVAGIGLGFIATFVRGALVENRDELVPYLEAQGLIRGLIDISGSLDSGLDVTSLAGLVSSDVRDRLPTSVLTLQAQQGESLTTLTTSTDDGDGQLDEVEHLALEAWRRAEPVVDRERFAFPLGQSTVVAGALAPSAGLSADEVARTITSLMRDLRASAVQLDTALLFADFRAAASADVRNRLAREMHDGVAQEIASLGYLVDALAARPATPKQAKQFEMLRGRITTIVGEVRQSVLTLRTSIGESASLGAAIGAVARHLSESSQIPIQVKLDEHATRLRPEVEAELFRIAQEAMNNAIRHSGCTAIEVTCQVYAPDALIMVTDDGHGMQAARSDSHGLKIMRERARLVNGELTIIDRPEGGLAVAVQISSAGRIPHFSPPTPVAKVASP